MPARLHVRIPVIEADGDRVVGATVKFYQPGTASVSGVTTTGTPYAGNLYAAVTGGSPVSTTRTTDANGEVIVYSDTKSRFDVGIEIGGASPVARVATYEAFELDPADVMTSVSGEQSVIQTGTLAAPGLAQTGNLDTGFNVDSDGDPAVVKNGVGLLEATSTTLVLRTPDGGTAATFNDDGTLTAAGLLRSLGKYIVSDHGLLTGSTSANAAGNTSALQTLWNTVSANGGGEIIFPGDAEWPLNATVLDAQPGFSQSISIRGTNASTLLKLYGTAGPFLDISPSATSPLFQCGISDLRILHDSAAVASGATIRLGYTSRYHIDRVLMDANGAFIALQLIGNASVHAHDSTLTCRNVANAVVVDFAQTVATGGVQFTGCDLSGGGTANSRGLRFNNSALVDTIVLNHTSVKDHFIGIAAAANSGDVQNFQMNGGFLDGCGYCVSLQPSAGADYGALEFNGVWASAADGIVILSTANGGTVSGFVWQGGSWHDVATQAFLAQGGVSGVLLTGINMDLSQITGGAEIGLSFETLGGVAPSRVSLVNNILAGNTSAQSPCHFSALTKFHFGGGWVLGKRVTYDGALSSARTIGDYSFE